ncbi:MAG: AmmeMemoRadiSam system protein B, partial [Dehalococcoidales bacterium]|nr:AmmeMemoRadiSam system protein B [Dehalococcoidales bacterium]
MKIRESAVSGTFYPASKRELEIMLKTFIVPGVAQPEVIGCYLPHAGYVYSGAVTGAAISRLPPKDTYIVMGPSHTGAGEPFSLMPEGKWQTPLGEIEIDAVLSNLILKNTRYLKPDEKAHLQEHAVEVQLPFIQYLQPKAK